MINKILALAFVFISSISIAQEKNDSIIRILNDKIVRLEKSEDFLKKEIELSKREIEISSNEKIKAIDDTVYQIKKAHDHYYVVAIVGIFLTLGFLAVLMKYINSTSKKLVDKKLNEYFDENKEKFNELIDLKDSEKELLKSKNIVVITSNKDYDIIFIKHFLKEMGFKNITYIDDENEVPLQYDVLFLNNENTYLSEKVADYIELVKPESVLFTFGQNRVQPTNPKKWKNMASSSFRSQLYGNLLSSLKYQSTLEN